MLRVGTCGALRPDLELGELVMATEAIGDDGTSRALGVSDRAPASPASARGADGGRPEPGRARSCPPTCSTRTRASPSASWIAAGAIAVEMEAATLFALAARRGSRPARC